MRFYRLEKPNYIKDWAFAIVKSLGLSLLVVIAVMMIFGYKFMIVSSGSMEPVLPVGSLIIIQPCDYEDLKLNDIVTMNANGIFLTHRVVGKMNSKSEILSMDDPDYENGSWYTKGDNSDTVDGIIRNEVVGTVLLPLTWVGTIVRYVRANYIMILVLGVILVAFIEVLNYLKSKLVEEDIECYENEE